MRTLLSLLEKIARRAAFRRSVRAQTWLIVADLLESEMELNRALPLVAEIQGRRRTTLQAILGDLRSSLRTDRFAVTVADHVPEAEAMLFRRFGQASDASVFRAAATLTGVDERIAKAIRQALMWPVFLFFLVFVLLYTLGTRLFPTLQTLAPIREWPLSSQLVANLAIGIANNAILVAVALVFLVAAYLSVERFHAGFGREWLDRFPPFSLYRLRMGATFAFVLLENARVGHEINRAFLLNLAAGLPSYSRSRILAIAEYADRTNIGNAAMLAGHGFPDPELIAVLRAYAGQADWVPRYGRYASAWLDRLQGRVDSMVQFLRLGLMIVATVIIGSAAFVMVNITSLIQ